MDDEDPRKRSRLGEIPGHVRAFIQTKAAYYRLTAAEGAAGAASGAALGIVLFLLGIFFLTFFFTAIAYLIGQALDNIGMGFLIIAGFFLALIALIFIFRRPLIQTPVTNSIITAIAGKNTVTNGQENQQPAKPEGRERTAADTGR